MSNRTPTRYKARPMQQAYSACFVGFHDPLSELYLKDGSRHRGALHRCAFWDGYEGKPSRPHAVPRTLAWACYMAGRDCAALVRAGQRNTTEEREQHVPERQN